MERQEIINIIVYYVPMIINVIGVMVLMCIDIYRPRRKDSVYIYWLAVLAWFPFVNVVSCILTIYIIHRLHKIYKQKYI